MKRLLPLLFMLIAFSTKAQIVNIPDPNFKSFLLNCNSPVININSDNEIQESEAAAVNFLTINSVNNITDLTGIRSFTNLQQLSITSLPLLTSLDLSGLSNIRDLTISQMGSITAVNISGLNNLSQLNISQLALATVINTTGVNSSRFDLNQVPVTSLNMSSFTSLRDLTINQTQISSLDLTNSTTLTNAWIGMNFLLSSLNVSGITSLHVLNCANNNLSNLSIAGATGITNLDCSVNQLTSLNVAGFNNLNAVYCGNNNITNLDIHDLPNLTFIHCSDNNLTSLSFSNCSLLREFVCGNENYFTSLDLSNGLPALVAASCINMPSLTSINLANCPNLQSVSCQGTSVSNLDLSGKQFLTGVVCFNTGLTSLNVAGCTALQYLEISNNQLTTLDFSSCPSLTNLGANNNQLTYLNIKNGSTFDLTNNLFRADGNPGLQYVCADENEVNSILGYFAQNAMPTVNVNSYCSFTPGGVHNSINGSVKIDTNNNGCDAGDPVIAGLTIKIDDGTNVGYTSSNSLGEFLFYTNAGNFTITPQIPTYFTTPPASVSFATAGSNIQTADFCIVPNGVHNDLEISIIPVSPARPGFNATYKLVYKNRGTQSLSGNVELNFEGTRANYMNAAPAVTTQNTDLLSWSYSNLQPLETRSIDVSFHILPPPINNITDTLSYTANITPLAGDETPADNSFTMKQVLIGSMDPNDKVCMEGSRISITRVGDYVHYLVRFQNTGTYVAENVVVKDMLQNSLDWNTVELVKTSHPCIFRQTGGNKLEFIFEGINLPALSVDEPGSHGYIAFKVKTIGSLQVGDQVSNDASIYFDFNLPVVTNSANTVVSSEIVIPVSVEYFKGAIQSGKHLLNWKVNCTSVLVKFDIERSTDGRTYSSMANITASNTRCLQPFDLTDNNPAAGMNYYRIKMTDVDGKVSYSSTIVLLNKKTGFEIVNLLPNPVVGNSALLNITSAEKQLINIKVTDASGKIVQSVSQSVISGFTVVDMNFSKLAAGVYSINIYTSNGERKTTQFIKQ